MENHWKTCVSVGVGKKTQINEFTVTGSTKLIAGHVIWKHNREIGIGIIYKYENTDKMGQDKEGNAICKMVIHTCVININWKSDKAVYERESNNENEVGHQSIIIKNMVG